MLIYSRWTLLNRYYEKFVFDPTDPREPTILYFSSVLYSVQYLNTLHLPARIMISTNTKAIVTSKNIHNISSELIYLKFMRESILEYAEKIVNITLNNIVFNAGILQKVLFISVNLGDS